MNKIFKFCLEKTPETNWRKWDDLKRIKENYIGILDVTPYCLVFHPEESQTYVRYFKFDSMLWEPSYFEGEKLGPSFHPWEISHWALMPYPPFEWDLDSEEYANKCGDWAIENNIRRKHFEDNTHILKSNSTRNPRLSYLRRGEGI